MQSPGHPYITLAEPRQRACVYDFYLIVRFKVARDRIRRCFVPATEGTRENYDLGPPLDLIRMVGWVRETTQLRLPCLSGTYRANRPPGGGGDGMTLEMFFSAQFFQKIIDFQIICYAISISAKNIKKYT